MIMDRLLHVKLKNMMLIRFHKSQIARKIYSFSRLVFTIVLVFFVSTAMLIVQFGLWLQGSVTFWFVLFISTLLFIIAATVCHFATVLVSRLWVLWMVLYSLPHVFWYSWWIYIDMEVAKIILLIPVLTIAGCIFGSKRALLYLQSKNRVPSNI